MLHECIRLRDRSNWSLVFRQLQWLSPNLVFISVLLAARSIRVTAEYGDFAVKLCRSPFVLDNGGTIPSRVLDTSTLCQLLFVFFQEETCSAFHGDPPLSGLRTLPSGIW